MALLTRRTLLAATGTVLAAGGLGKLAGWWGVDARQANAQSVHAPSGNAAEADAPQVDMRPLSAIERADPPKTLAPVRFTTLDGAPKTLADYAGRPLVVNFWATWCIPCVAELPELDELAASGVVVLAVSADRGGAATVRPFVAAHQIRHVTLLLDPGNAAVNALGVAGFPTTLLIGADGRLRGTLEGPAAWGKAGPEIAKLMG